MKAAAVLFVLGTIVATPRAADAYSVLSHEANIDALWDTGIRPLLLRRYPGTTSDDLLQARAYAYGGSVIQDLGYYPFGSHFFSNLVHYVRSGDFVEALIREAHDVNEYAFALGALAHYAADNVGHPEGVNRAVGVMYPKLRARYGNSVTYADSPATHAVVEFSFDVVQAAVGVYVSDAYRSFIGFQVAKPVLERAFAATYGLEMKDLFLNEDFAIGTYRRAIARTVPAITRIAWRDKREEIEKIRPGVGRTMIVFNLSRKEYDTLYGGQYEKPGLLARFLGALYKLVPKIGPLRPLQFKAPTKEAEAMFLESVTDTRQRYGMMLDAVGRRRLDLANTNFDTGKPTVRGEYALADDTYAELLHRLAKPAPAAIPDDLRAHVAAFFAVAPARTPSKKDRKRAEEVRHDLAALDEGVNRR